ncbi:hypothetical protein BDY24DRAFT_373172 [Mrakia frigida]|uniref:uncharacterized protein n=1 Tax=Mrakia frigida TaxID=29902 RepID=UPI003FCC26A0
MECRLGRLTSGLAMDWVGCWRERGGGIGLGLGLEEEEEGEGWKVGEEDRLLLLLLLKFRKGAAMVSSKDGSFEFDALPPPLLKAALILDPSRSRFLSCPCPFPFPYPPSSNPPPLSKFSQLDSSSATADPPPRATSSRARCDVCLSSHHS